MTIKTLVSEKTQKAATLAMPIGSKQELVSLDGSKSLTGTVVSSGPVSKVLLPFGFMYRKDVFVEVG